MRVNSPQAHISKSTGPKNYSRPRASLGNHVRACEVGWLPSVVVPANGVISVRDWYAAQKRFRAEEINSAVEDLWCIASHRWATG
ncbi:hypothetical protein CRG98_004459 [Punica granatum]|uniref:Uncharacterized protein n=1 Tax=Punica granatum TaxID=22663 RepID=A0A2I0L361_PUNGR|nr:hypothetical protein CRG98_004459 [Punica granatum]